MRRVRYSLWRGSLAFAAVFLAAGIGHALNFQIEKLFGRVPVAPTPVVSEGKTSFAYELWLTSLEKEAVTLDKVEAFADDATEAWLTLEGAEVDEVAEYFGEKAVLEAGPYIADGGDTDAASGLAPGSSVMLMLWVDAPEGEGVPDLLTHTVTYRKTDGSEVVVKGIVTPVSPRVAPILGPPVRDGVWIMVNGPSDRGHHWPTVFTAAGEPRISQRFAADWMKLSDDGTLFRGEGRANEEFCCFGEDLVAMADGTVVAARDGLEDILPWHAPETEAWVDANDIGGNHVILDVGGGVFIFYAHLKQDSVLVKAGDRVHQGDVLGKLGNSGNTDAPHLHLHIMSADGEALYAVGLPYALAAYEYLGTWDSVFDDLDAGKGYDLAGATAQPYAKDLPRANAVIRIDESATAAAVGADAEFDAATGRLRARNLAVGGGFVEAAFVAMDGVFVLDSVVAAPSLYPRDGARWDPDMQTVALPRVRVEEATYAVILKKIDADGLVFTLQSVIEVE
jgi:hypothetical protein